MDGMRTGLRHRLQRVLRRIEEQHRHLRTIESEIERCLSAGGSDLDGWVGRLRHALRAHFDLEERVVFPALHGLVPALRKDLERLERDHADFLRELDALVRGLGRGASALEALRGRLADHERLEERLMAQGLARGGPSDPGTDPTDDPS